MNIHVQVISSLHHPEKNMNQKNFYESQYNSFSAEMNFEKIEEILNNIQLQFKDELNNIEMSFYNDFKIKRITTNDSMEISHIEN